MQDAVKAFSYTARRNAYWNIVVVFAFLCVVEGGATELLISLLVPLLWLKLTIVITTVVSYLYTMILIFYPLKTKHRLTATHLHLHYGLSLNVRVLLSDISTIQAVRKSSSRAQPISASYDGNKQRIVACFSDQDMVLLTFKQPLALKIGLKARATSNILLNVDQRDEFINALTATKQTGMDLSMTASTSVASESVAGI